MPVTGVSRPELNLLPDRISEFCTRWKIRELSLFGSVLRDDFDSQSDIDVLVSFEPGHPWSLYDLVDMQDELEASTHRKIDLVVKEGLRNPFRREAILNSRKVLYAAG